MLKIIVGKRYQGDEDDAMIIGVKKAVALCEQIDYIRKFSEKHENEGRRE